MLHGSLRPGNELFAIGAVVVHELSRDIIERALGEAMVANLFSNGLVQVVFVRSMTIWGRLGECLGNASVRLGDFTTKNLANCTPNYHFHSSAVLLKCSQKPSVCMCVCVYVRTYVC